MAAETGATLTGSIAATEKIGKRYNRQQLLESIVKPSAQIAQGFNTTVFVMTSGTTHTGFVVREGAEDVEIRTAEGKSVVLLTPGATALRTLLPARSKIS